MNYKKRNSTETNRTHRSQSTGTGQCTAAKRGLGRGVWGRIHLPPTLFSKPNTRSCLSFLQSASQYAYHSLFHFKLCFDCFLYSEG